MGNHNKAIDDFREAIKITEGKPQVNNFYQYYYLGISLLKSRQPKEALKELEKADGLASSGYPGISNAIGLSWHQVCEYNNAEERFNDAIREAKTSEEFVEFFSNRADLFYDWKKYDKAA